MSKAYLNIALALALGGCALAERPQPVSTSLAERVQLLAGTAVLSVEVARTAADIRRGLMHRESMPQDAGMLFVFSEAKTQCFWMKNTSIPLTAAFLDQGGRILNLVDMEPHTGHAHCSEGPALYVVEAHRGWFRARGINRGDRMTALQILTSSSLHERTQ